jgi:hypothetical protein
VEIHSDVNYPEAEAGIAKEVALSFSEAPAEHDMCLFRIKEQDRAHLDYQRIAQLAEDSLGYGVSWRLMETEEVIINGGADIGSDVLLVLKREGYTAK